jgi:CheY-like chemotaxis protein/HPt (histidine-containing phosphotransfer) domain-containing protein
VILNLMSNAVKFTRSGTVTLAVRETVKADGGITLRVSVRDTGIGIDDAGKSKLFLPFSQVDASITRKYGGTGLGLTICKEIVERLGGTIGVDSRIGSGSTFWFEVPVEAGRPPAHMSSALRTPALPLPRLKILLVEDNPVNLHVATRFLAHLGQDVEAAENGAVAVQKCETAVYDLILMDMQMPVMDGIEATIRIRGGTGPSSRSPIVAMTANASDDDTRKCIDAGMDGFQSKPVNMDKLRQVIRSAVSSQAVEHVTSAPAPQDAPESAAGAAREFDLAAFRARRAELVDVLGEDDFQELLASFFDDARDALRELAASMARDDADGIDRLLHVVKGAAGNVGLRSVAELAEKLRKEPLDAGALQHLSATVDICSEHLAA